MIEGDQTEHEPADIEDDGTEEDRSLLEAQLAEVEREKDQFRKIAARAQADLVNYRKRAADELEEARRSAKTGLLLGALEVIDEFERAMSLVPEEEVAPGWMEGLHLVHRKMRTMLESEGVSKIEILGRQFDPRESEAVLYEESESAAEGEVIQVFREGYRQRDRVLRHAQVIVAKQVQHQHEENEEAG